MWSLFGLSNDFFIRTTDPEHIAEVQRILVRLHDKGDIYKGSYGGWYCTSCEAFYNEGDLHSPKRDGPTSLIRIEGTNMEKVKRFKFEQA